MGEGIGSGAFCTGGVTGGTTGVGDGTTGASRTAGSGRGTGGGSRFCGLGRGVSVGAGARMICGGSGGAGTGSALGTTIRSTGGGAGGVSGWGRGAGGVEVRQFASDLEVNGDRVVLSPLTFQLFGGRYQGAVSAQL